MCTVGCQLEIFCTVAPERFCCFLFFNQLKVLCVGLGQRQRFRVSTEWRITGLGVCLFHQTESSHICNSCLEQSCGYWLALIFHTPQNQRPWDILSKWKGLEEEMENVWVRERNRRKNFHALRCTPEPQYFLPHMHEQRVLDAVREFSQYWCLIEAEVCGSLQGPVWWIGYYDNSIATVSGNSYKLPVLRFSQGFTPKWHP